MARDFVIWSSFTFLLFMIMPTFSEKTEASGLRYIMYLTGQHNIVPEPDLVSNLTHVALAFMRPNIFNDVNRTEWPMFTTVKEARLKFAEGTIVQVAIGGWGDTEGFEVAAKTEQSRELFAENIKRMLDMTGADGVDIDWEYPGGNGEDYKTHPNSEKEWQIAAYPQLLASIRAAIGPSKVISAAVPGLPRDMIAFTHETIPKIVELVDFLNIMTYDLMNRRDNVIKHHTGMQISLEGINAYLERGVPPNKANLGLAFYVRWFRTTLDASCDKNPIGCKTELMENPENGADLGKAGSFSWNNEVPSEFSGSFQRALEQGKYDEEGGGYFYWDTQERLFWTFDTPDAIKRKVPAVLNDKKLGGCFAWGLGEDAPKFSHLRAANDALATLSAGEAAGANKEKREL